MDIDEPVRRGAVGRPKLPVDLELLKTGVDTQTPVSKLQGVEKQKRQMWERARRSRQRNTRRNLRAVYGSTAPGIDTLAIERELAAVGLSPTEVRRLTPIIAKERYEALQADRIAKAEQAAREQAENAVHNLRAAKYPAHAVSKMGRR